MTYRLHDHRNLNTVKSSPSGGRFIVPNRILKTATDVVKKHFILLNWMFKCFSCYLTKNYFLKNT